MTMNAMVRVVLLALIGAVAMAEARLFETEAECEARYGKPVKRAAPELPATRAWTYCRNGISVTIHFVEGRAWLLEFPYLTREQKKLIVAANLEALGGTRQLTDRLKPSLVSPEEKKAQEQAERDLTRKYPRGEVIELKVNYWGLRIVAKDWEKMGEELRAKHAIGQAAGF